MTQHLQLIDDALDKDEEISPRDLQSILWDAGVNVSLSSIAHAKKHPGKLYLLHQ